MAKLGAEQPVARGREARALVESMAQPERVETPRSGYRRVFACAAIASDSPDEERTPVTRVGED